MVLKNALRLVAIFAMVLVSGTAMSAYAAVTPPSYFVAMQDLEDDDGDGIPNFLDPDYVPKEQIVEEEPAEPEPEPEPTTPAEEVPVVDEPDTDEPIVEEPTIEEPEPESEVEVPVVEEEETQPEPEVTPAPQAVQVTTLPDTGTGFGTVVFSVSHLISVIPLLLLLAAMTVRWQSRML